MELGLVPGGAVGEEGRGGLVERGWVVAAAEAVGVEENQNDKADR